MNFAYVDLEGPVSWCPRSPLALTFFLPATPQGSLISKGRELMETPHLELSVPGSFHFLLMATDPGIKCFITLNHSLTSIM